MIVGRIIDDLRQQNWTKLILELLVLITGVFLGLQVDDWNEDRKDRVREDMYLNRLHGEILEAIEVGHTNFNTALLIDGHISEVLDVFDLDGNLDSLGPLHCYAIFASHIYVGRNVRLPSMTELLSTGQLSIIQNERLKRALAQYSMVGDGLNTLLENIQPSNLLLSRKYPELVRLDRRMRNVDNLDEFAHDCDFGAMKRNDNFNNDLIDNNSRKLAFVATVRSMFDILRDIHDELDGVLQIVHETPPNNDSLPID